MTSFKELFEKFLPHAGSLMKASCGSSSNAIIIPYPIPGTSIVLRITRGRPISSTDIRDLLKGANIDIQDRTVKHGPHSRFDYWEYVHGHPALEIYAKSFGVGIEWTKLRSIIDGLRSYFDHIGVWCDIDFQMEIARKPIGQGRLQKRLHIDNTAVSRRDLQSPSELAVSLTCRAVGTPDPQGQIGTYVYQIPHSRFYLEIDFYRLMNGNNIHILLESAQRVVQDQIHIFGAGSKIPNGAFTWHITEGNFLQACSLVDPMSWQTLSAALRGVEDVLVGEEHSREAIATIFLPMRRTRRTIGWIYVRKNLAELSMTNSTIN
ncbi:MAG: hypothetical protein Q9190_007835 [Brigantiaea leucoxantha]